MPSLISWGTIKGLLIILPIVSFIFYIFGSAPESPTFNTRHGHSPVFKYLELKNKTSSFRTPTIEQIHNATSKENSVHKSSSTNRTSSNGFSNSDLTLTLSPTNSTSIMSIIRYNRSKVNSSIASVDINSKGANDTTLPLCPDVSNELLGRVPVVQDTVPGVSELEKQFSWLQPGGHWHPETCRVLKKVAIVIPFRCRGKHLLLFLNHMHPFLKRQQIDYTIFIIEQEGDGPFNRAMLMNIGFKEALKIRYFDCFIFHDIDLLPEDDRNTYSCPIQPRHMSVAVDIFHYKLPYPSIFGGVSAITREHFKLLNGFSNSFWGWGGEDDDMSNRIRYHNLFISRYPPTISRYTMLTHKKDVPSPNRYEILTKGTKMYDKDGLNNLKYKVVQKRQHLLYTWILVEIHPPS